MKISKLFHWLYAFLMFLPIFAIAVKCGYVMLNENSKDDYTGNYSFMASHNYSITMSNASKPNYNSYTGLDERFLFDESTIYPSPNYSGRGFTFYNVIPYVPSINVDLSNVHYVTFRFANSYQLSQIYFTEREPTYTDLVADGNFTNANVILSILPSTSFYLTFTSESSYTYSTNFGSGKSIIVTYSEFVEDGSLSSVFYSALQELDEVEFFSWAKYSFLAQPFMYIGNLFGIPSVHPIFTFLSYWMAISVIWLVFDVFMYVPLLAHKWIDKGKVD